MLAFAISIAIVQLAGLDIVGVYAVSVAVMSVSVGLLGSALDTHSLRRYDATSTALPIAAKLLVWIAASPVVLIALYLLDVPWMGGIAVYAAMFFLHIAETKVVAARLSNQDANAVLPRIVPSAAFLAALLMFRPASFELVSILLLLSSTLIIFFAGVTWSDIGAVTYRDIVTALRATKGIATMLVFTQVYGNLDLILVKTFLDHTAAGEYRIAQAFAAVLMPAIAVLAFVYLSRLRGVTASGDVAQLRRMLLGQLRLHVTLGFSVALLMLFLLPWLIPLLYGKAAAPAVSPAVVLCGGAALNAVAMVFIYTLLGLEEDRLVLKVTAATSVASVVLNVLLIPVYGTSGAAWANVTTYLLMLGVLTVTTARALRLFRKHAEAHRCRLPEDH